MQHMTQAVVAFVSFVIIPFLGVLGLFRIRIFQYLLTFWILWLVYGGIAVNGGAMPMGEGDIVTPEQRAYWYATPWVRYVMPLWLKGIALGIPLLVITWAYENARLSPIVKRISDFITAATFVGGAVQFFRQFVLKP